MVSALTSQGRQQVDDQEAAQCASRWSQDKQLNTCIRVRSLRGPSHGRHLRDDFSSALQNEVPRSQG